MYLLSKDIIENAYKVRTCSEKLPKVNKHTE